ncbi:hypothetical protein GCM10009834_45370 [Streptomonospora arabica]
MRAKGTAARKPDLTISAVSSFMVAMTQILLAGNPNVCGETGVSRPTLAPRRSAAYSGHARSGS